MHVLTDFLLLLVVLVPAPKNRPDERAFSEQTSAEFQKTFEELNPKGWRLAKIKGYEKDGISRFDSEWHKPAEPPRFYCHHDIDRDVYDTKSAQLKAAGYREVLKSAWKINGKDRFWAVWELK